MTDDLAAFITARLGEDEAAAKAATPGPWNASMEDILSCADDPYWAGACAANASGDDATHIARHDPARVLREVAAMRAIVRWHPSEQMRYIDASRCPQCELTWPCPTVRLITAVWSGHPDYRDEWKP